MPYQPFLLPVKQNSCRTTQNRTGYRGIHKECGQATMMFSSCQASKMDPSETQVSLSSRNRLAFRLDCLHEGFFAQKTEQFLWMNPSMVGPNYWGKFAGTEPAVDRYKHYVMKAFSGDDRLSTFAWEEVSSGLAAVWARENTREAIFEAMQKKESCATTGTCITVRFFGG
ncbi:MAG: DUF3604 domain-containing protein [Deltaproteobacteria bacterium]|nr:MAG: DUF3604 domain-containing protein [Deltaproteobacteria bacterium]